MKTLPVILLALLFSVTGCSSGDPMSLEEIENMDVDCHNVKNKLYLLNRERFINRKEATAKIRAFSPLPALSGLLRGTYGTNWKIATGEWKKEVDNKIDELRKFRDYCKTIYPNYDDMPLEKHQGAILERFQSGDWRGGDGQEEPERD